MKLQYIAYILGGLGLLASVLTWWAPERTRTVCLAFPRSRVLGGVLTALGLIWVAWLLYNVPMGRFEFLKNWIFPATPVCWVLLFFFLDDLLAVRALGGLLLLVAAPMLDAARWVDSSWRLVITCIAYAWVLFGILMVLGPYRFRHLIIYFMSSPAATRRWALLKACVSILLILLGALVYARV